MNEVTQTPIHELDKFLGGALSERVARAVGEIAANIMDINTEASKARKLTITLTIKPNKSRKMADITTNVTTALAGVQPIESSAQIGFDEQTGELVMVEETEQLPGQMNLEGEETKPNVMKMPATAERK